MFWSILNLIPLGLGLNRQRFQWKSKMNSFDEEFYIGYKKMMPPGLSAHLRWMMLLLGGIVLMMLILITIGQQPFDKSFFEFGRARSFSGIIMEKPFPFLLVPEWEKDYLTYDLVAQGKFCAQESFRGLDMKTVTLRGSLIYRDNHRMIEIVPGSVVIESEGSAASYPDQISLGEQSLVGEIVDSKCYLGVMNPGKSKVHRACAIRCISGGIPPAFIVKDQGGESVLLLLVGRQGEPINQRILDMVAEPLQITGEVLRVHDRLILKADPETFRRPSI